MRKGIISLYLLFASLVLCVWHCFASTDSSPKIIFVYLALDMKSQGAEYALISTDGNGAVTEYKGMAKIINAIKALESKSSAHILTVCTGSLSACSNELRAALNKLSTAALKNDERVYFVNVHLLAPMERCLFVAPKKRSAKAIRFQWSYEKGVRQIEEDSSREKLASGFWNTVCFLGEHSKAGEFSSVKAVIAAPEPNFGPPYPTISPREPEDPFKLPK